MEVATEIFERIRRRRSRAPTLFHWEIRLIAVPAPMIVLTIAFAKVPITVMVPVVVMFKPPVISIPVAWKELFSIVVWRHPAGSFVGWPSPITFVPSIVSFDRIPIAFHPHELWSGSGR